MPTIEKRKGEVFTIGVTFTNIGDASGSWDVNSTFKGDWNWDGASQTITLNPGESTTVTWSGTTPDVVNQSSNLSIAYNGSEYPTDWWIHVTGEPSLDISLVNVI